MSGFTAKPLVELTARTAWQCDGTNGKHVESISYRWHHNGTT